VQRRQKVGKEVGEGVRVEINEEVVGCSRCCCGQEGSRGWFVVVAREGAIV